MADGQEAGLMHYARNVCALVVSRDAQGRTIHFEWDDAAGPSTALTAKQVWLRSTWGMEGVGRFSYSVDGIDFHAIGTPCKAGWAFYRGDRIGIWSAGRSGYVDVDSFTYTSRQDPGRSSVVNK